MKTEKPKQVKEKTDEAVAKTTNAELKEELKVNKNQLEEHYARLNGGMSKAMGREIRAIDKELEQRKRVVEMKKIELSKDAPMNPLFQYETDERWRELKRKFIEEEIVDMENVVIKIEEQKQNILNDIPMLKNRINEIEKELGLELTKFQSEEANYIG